MKLFSLKKTDAEVGYILIILGVAAMITGNVLYGIGHGTLYVMATFTSLLAIFSLVVRWYRNALYSTGVALSIWLFSYHMQMVGAEVPDVTYLLYFLSKCFFLGNIFGYVMFNRYEEDQKQAKIKAVVRSQDNLR